jgi:hypothetical protein
MATRQQIARLTQRIEALGASKDGRPGYVWRNDGESVEEALARHYKDRPQDRAKQVYIFQWRGRRDRSDPSNAAGHGE